MLGRVLPAAVAVAEAFDDLAPAPLFAAEQALMAGRGERRRRQFATARTCARRALAQLGQPGAALLPGPGGAPRWPAGTTGSITHCEGYRAAAAVRTGALLSLGIDAEPALALPAGVLSLAAGEEERRHLAALPAGGVPWDRLLFCAKEAVYKAWYPLGRRWLGLRDAEVRLDTAGTFSAVLRAGAAPAGVPWHYSGRWVADGGLLLAAVAVPAVPAAPAAARAGAPGAGAPGAGAPVAWAC
ncbi:4'-phosphopantetheinyl transferase [Kitasatospora sp. NPDC058170]|uniref:4'-phosphopantetheinyl transferase family protein n=1 Tax=Kitasatospora sp. NPDC058170 TaxID=3346364 RepID=UPI0036DBFEB7